MTHQKQQFLVVVETSLAQQDDPVDVVNFLTRVYAPHMTTSMRVQLACHLVFVYGVSAPLWRVGHKITRKLGLS